MKVLLVGLPLFSERLQSELSAFDKKNRYLRLDTYYNKWDKLKALLLIPFVDVVYSINGAVDRSLVFSWALFWNKKVCMTWVGTDVIKAQKVQTPNPKFIQNVQHYCEVSWIKDELNEMGIEARIQNFASFDKQFERNKAKNKRLTVLSYIPDNRAVFYGIEEFLQLANECPGVDFIMVGGTAKAYAPLPSNVQTLGWVKDMQPHFEKADVCMRYPEHDGLSVFILESLARAKQVMYKFPLPHCYHVPNHAACMQAIQSLKEKKATGEALINNDGADYIEAEYNRAKILGELVAIFEAK